MRAAEKLLMLLLAILFGVAFINHGQIALSSGPKGASVQTAFYGIVP